MMTALVEAGLERLLPLYVLVVARTLPLTLALPSFGSGRASFAARFVLALFVTAVVAPSASPLVLADLDLVSGLLLFVREFAIGALFAFTVAIPLIAMGFSGSYLDRFAAFASPRFQPHQRLLLFAGFVVFLVSGAHRLALRVFADGLLAAPVGSNTGSADFFVGAMELGAKALALSATFALPALVAIFMHDFLRLAVGRVGAQSYTEGSARALRPAFATALALLLLAALLPRLMPLVQEWIGRAAF